MGNHRGEKSHIRNRRPNINNKVGSLDKDDVYNAFYDKSKRRLFVVTTDGIDFSMRMVEDIDARKEFLYDKNILSNPYNFKDL